MKSNYPILAFLSVACLYLNSFSASAQCAPDIQGPVAVCEANVNLSLPASGFLPLAPDFFDAGSFDNCTTAENLTFQITPSAVSCADVGSSITVIMTVLDEAGNSNFCQSTAFVEDKIGPVLACEDVINISIPTSGEALITPEILLASYSDNCDLNFEISPLSVSCADIGSPVPFTIIATDPGGNTSSCGGTLIVEDKLNFAIGCYANVNAVLSSSGELTLTPEMLVAFDNDNCPLSYSISPSLLDCSNAGENVMVTVTATDAGGNVPFCLANVFVVDPTPSAAAIVPPPSITCGATGLVFNSNISGSPGPFIYDWKLKKGASSGWAITSTTDGPFITMTAGTGKLNLKLVVKGICGGKVKDKFKFTPDCDAAVVAHDYSGILPLNESANRQASFVSDIDFSIYPNPAMEEFNINVKKSPSGIVSLKIFNNMGQQMSKTIRLGPNNQKVTLPISHFPTGVYFVELSLENGDSVVKRLLKQ